MAWEDYKVSVPPGVCGNWRVEPFSVSTDASRVDAMVSMFSGSARYVSPGIYTGLYRGASIIMSDTHDEIRDHVHFIRRARGSVLIAGLGLGMVLQAVARKAEVTSVTVVEKSSDVLALVANHYKSMPVVGAKLTVVHADIFGWKPAAGVRFDHAWFDIWDNLSVDNLAEMATLHRRFARIAGDKGSWGKEALRSRRDRQRRQRPMFSWAGAR